MANEIVFSGLGDLTVAARLSGILLLLAADRNALPNHEAILYVGDIAGSGSNVIQVPHVGLLGYDLQATTSEGSAPSNSALTDGSTAVTVIQKSKVYQSSDLTRMVDATGSLNEEMMAMDALITANATLASMVANIVDDFTAYVGTSGNNATLLNYLEAQATLAIAKASGPFLAMLHPRQWADILQDIGTATGGAISTHPQSAAVLAAMKGLGLVGDFLGSTVFTSAHVPTANTAADRAGGMFARGGVVWGSGRPPVSMDSNQLIIGESEGGVLFEKFRAATGYTSYQSTCWRGVSKGVEAMGVSIITDA